ATHFFCPAAHLLSGGVGLPPSMVDTMAFTKLSTLFSRAVTSPVTTQGGFASAFATQPFTGSSNLVMTLPVHAGSSGTPVPSALPKQPRSPVALPLAHLIFADEHFPVAGPEPAWALTVPSRSAAADS